MLRRNWGVADRNDMINAANHLIKQKRVDPKRLCIMGSSAGGYLLLATVLKSELFSAAASLYGVSDLVGLAKVSLNRKAVYPSSQKLNLMKYALLAFHISTDFNSILGHTQIRTRLQ